MTKKERKQGESTRQLIGAKSITDYSVVTYSKGELVLFMIKPNNISVLSENSINARIYALMTVLKGVAEIELCCLSSKESFDDNKRYLKKRLEQEDNMTVRKLLEKDLKFLDQIQLQMATAREFLIIIRYRKETQTEIFQSINRIGNVLKEQGFEGKRADREDIKRIMAVYFEQNVAQDEYQDYNGERWVIIGEE